ncbi:MAG: serpin family protein [Prevotella sp.]
MYQPDEPRHVVFHANHPFIYMITERVTNTIFFIGQYTGPTE